MSDDTKLRGGQDRTRINLDQDHEVRYWTKELGVTAEQLRDAVKRAGSSTVEKVRAALRKG
jgi:Tfp pilus assembly PilM family ATPase